MTWSPWQRAPSSSVALICHDGHAHGLVFGDEGASFRKSNGSRPARGSMVPSNHPIESNGVPSSYSTSQWPARFTRSRCPTASWATRITSSGSDSVHMRSTRARRNVGQSVSPGFRCGGGLRRIDLERVALGGRKRSTAVCLRLPNALRRLRLAVAPDVRAKGEPSAQGRPARHGSVSRPEGASKSRSGPAGTMAFGFTHGWLR